MQRQKPNTSKINTFITGSIIVGLALFLFWCAFAPLDSATISEGYITTNENYKTIYHPTGGMIEKIMVQEGSVVQKKQPLIILKDTTNKNKTNQINLQLAKEKATKQRLLAQEQENKHIHFPKDTFAKCDNNDTQAIKTIQERLFKNHREQITFTNTIFQARIKQSQNRIKNLELKLTAIKEQIAPLHTSITLQKSQSLVNNFDEYSSSIKKNLHELESDKAIIQNQIYEASKELNAIKLEKLEYRHKTKKRILAKLQNTQKQIWDYQQQLNSTKEELQYLVIHSPISGIVTNLQVHNNGQEIKPKTKIMNIFPKQEKLVVVTKIHPKDIGNIKIGSPAYVQLTAYKTKLVPRIKGSVIYISPDHILDEITKTYRYLIKVKLSDPQLKQLKTEINLQPGMPTTVFIVKGSHTLLQYLISPIRESFWKAFKEQ